MNDVVVRSMFRSLGGELARSARGREVWVLRKPAGKNTIGDAAQPSAAPKERWRTFRLARRLMMRAAGRG
jgi:hypothetical protein